MTWLSPVNARWALSSLLAALFTALIAGSSAGEPAACPSFTAASTGLPTWGEWRTHPVFGDANGDGHVDIAGNPRKGDGPGVWFGDGKGGWRDGSSGLLMRGFTCGVGVDFADLDGDGRMELGVADHCLGIHIYHYHPNGAWQMRAEPATHRVRGGFDDLQFGDVDGDGKVDVVATGAMRGGFAVLTDNGKGKWGRMKTNLPTRGYAPDVKLADIDGDGDLDIAAAFTSEEHGPDRVLPRLPVVWLNDKNGRFRSFSRGLPQKGDFRGVSLGDLNGDGRLDLAISGGRWPGRPPLLMFLQPERADGAWHAVPGGHPKVGSTDVFEGVALGDVNQDGVLDLAAVEHRTAGLHLWRGLGGGAFERCDAAGLPESHEDERGWGLAIGDVNGDGKADLAYAHGRGKRGAIEVFLQSDIRSGVQRRTMSDPVFPIRVGNGSGPTPAP